MTRPTPSNPFARSIRELAAGDADDHYYSLLESQYQAAYHLTDSYRQSLESDAFDLEADRAYDEMREAR